MPPPPTQTPLDPVPTLEEIHDSLDLPGHRVEIIRRRIVVSPSPARNHNRVIRWLMARFEELCVENGWDQMPQATADLLVTEERIIPDLLLCREDESKDGEWLVSAEEIFLVVEVVSRSSLRDDYENKRQSCALNEIPAYLIVDPFTARLTLCTEPSDDGYRMVHTVDAGAKLDIPAPIDFTLDTTTMPAHRTEK
jgi:Uma2 family endonuclease